MADTKFQPGHPGGPGRPPGSKSAEVLFREAIKKLAEKNNIEPDDIEIDLIHTIFKQAKNGNLKAMEMYLDRIYGKPKQSTDINTTVTVVGDVLNSIGVTRPNLTDDRSGNS